MKYIEKVILENFQSHKYSIIEFDNSLNVIVGASDSGKTSILRGIKWVLYNEPSGDYFIREGETECSVTLFFSDNTKVKRYRSRSKNAYYLYNSMDEEMIFEGFGTSVPEEIQKSTGIKKLLFDRDIANNINISDQLDGAFLLSERSSIRSSSIGRLVGVNILDDALRDSLKDSRNLSISKKNIEDTISDLEEELLEYNYLEDFKIKIERIESIKEEIESKSNRIGRYEELNNKIKMIKNEKDKLNNTILSLKNIEKSDEIIRNIQSANYLITHLSNSKIKLDKCSTEIKNLNYTIKGLEGIDKLNNKLDILNIAIDRLSKLNILKEKLVNVFSSKTIGEKYLKEFINIENAFDSFNSLSNNINRINKLVKLNRLFLANNQELTETNKILENYTKNIEILVDRYKDLLLNQETCPLCFSTIDTERINSIINHYN